jgi:plastocyanin
MRIWPAVAIGALIVLGLWTLVVFGRSGSLARASAATTQAVSMNDGTMPNQYRFAPDPITINVGTTVTWTNDTSQGNVHTTTSDSGDAVSWDSSTQYPSGVPAGASFSFTFNMPGTFTYHCTFHQSIGMVGTINVVNPTSTPTGTRTPQATLTSTPTATPTPGSVFLPLVFNNFSVAPVATPTPTITSPPSVSMTEQLRFVPDPITITVGTTVTWTNVATDIPHTTTSDTGLWDSGNRNPGQTFSFTFNTPGTFTYHCTYHQSVGMTGTITVR